MCSRLQHKMKCFLCSAVSSTPPPPARVPLYCLILDRFDLFSNYVCGIAKSVTLHMCKFFFLDCRMNSINQSHSDAKVPPIPPPARNVKGVEWLWSDCSPLRSVCQFREKVWGWLFACNTLIGAVGSSSLAPYLVRKQKGPKQDPDNKEETSSAFKLVYFQHTVSMIEKFIIADA